MIQDIAISVLLFAWALTYAMANVALAYFILRTACRLKKSFVRIPGST